MVRDIKRKFKRSFGVIIREWNGKFWNLKVICENREFGLKFNELKGKFLNLEEREKEGGRDFCREEGGKEGVGFYCWV